MNVIDELTRLEAFARVDPASRQLLEQGLVCQHLNRAAAVLHKGQPVSGAYIVLDGRLRVFTITPGGTEATIYFVNPGDTCVLALKMLKDSEESGLFQFLRVKSLTEKEESLREDEENEKILKDSFVFLKNVKTNLWITAKELNNIATASQEEEFAYVVEPFLAEIVSEKDTFRLFCANTNELWELNLLVSCFSSLYSFNRFLEENAGVFIYLYIYLFIILLILKIIYLFKFIYFKSFINKNN